MPGRKENILLVDDRQDGLIALQAVLNEPGYNLVLASSGSEALARVLEHEFALIILDVQMPDMDGFETASLIKQRDRSKNIPIIFVTAISKDLRYVYKGYETGAIDYLFKPFDPQILRSKVAVFVELYKTNRLLKEQAETLRRSEEKYRTLVEAARDIIATVDSSGLILSLNSAFTNILGYDPNDWIGKEVTPLIYLEDIEKALAQVIKAREGVPVLFEARAVAKNGAVIPVEASIKLVSEEYENGKGTLLAVIRDISERKRAEEESRRVYELERSNRELEQFAYICSHDLQEPLRIVTNFTQLLKKKFESRLCGEADDIVGYITSGTERMSRLIRDLLEVSRIGMPGLVMEATSSMAALHGAMRNLKLSIEENQASVTWDDLPVVQGNYSQLVQLFQNLLGNALKFRASSIPSIHFGCVFSDNQWLFSVKDNGIGFKMDYADRIFEIFKRLHTSDTYPGTGVGLAICKRIIERHAGRIWVNSNPGEGTTFFFTLPTASSLQIPKPEDIVSLAAASN